MIDLEATIEAMKEAGMDDASIVAALACLRLGELRTVEPTARQLRNKRYYDKRASEKRLKASEQDVSDAEPPLPSKEGPHTPKETQPTLTPIPPKGVPFPKSDAAAALQAYSEMADASGLAVPRAVTAGRRARLEAVLREYGLPTWVEAVGKVGASSFCRGENDRGWKADLDFLLQPKSFPKILEGHYDDRMPRAGPQQRRPMDNLINSLLTEMEMADASASAEIEGYSAAPCQLPGPAR